MIRIRSEERFGEVGSIRGLGRKFGAIGGWRGRRFGARSRRSGRRRGGVEEPVRLMGPVKDCSSTFAAFSQGEPVPWRTAAWACKPSSPQVAAKLGGAESARRPPAANGNHVGLPLISKS